MSRVLPYVTIGIPFFNSEDTLLDSIKSVFAQTHDRWELILIDDGSSDGSLEIALSLNDPRVRVVSDGKNIGLAARLNQIASMASYDYVARMDADDMMSPVRIEKQLNVLSDDPTVDLVSTGLCSLADDASITGIRVYTQNGKPNSGDFYRNRSGIVHASVIGKKEWFLKYQYDPSCLFCEDYELWLRSYMCGDLKYSIIAEPLYYYREDGNVVTRKLLKAYRSQIEVLRNINSGSDNFLSRRAAIIEFHLKYYLALTLGRLSLLKILRLRRNKDNLDLPLLNDLAIEIETILKVDPPRAN